MTIPKILQFLALVTLAFMGTEAAFEKRFPPSQILKITLPQVYLGDFEYTPIDDGYRLSYVLMDGTRRTEIGHIPGAGRSNAYKQLDPKANAERSAIKARNKKNRKLSPKSLQSLAG